MGLNDAPEVIGAGDAQATQNLLQLGAPLQIELDGERMTGTFGRPASVSFRFLFHGSSMENFKGPKSSQ